MCDSEQYFGGIPPAGIMLNARNFSATYYTSREVWVGVSIIAININIIKVLDKVRSHKLEEVLAGLEV